LQIKITRMNGLLRKALDALKHSGRYNGLYAEIESGLAQLKLHELEVDVKSVQLELSAELAILREAVENPPPVAGVSDEEVQKLTKEIDELKSQLEAAKSRGAAASSSAPPPLPTPGGVDRESEEKIRTLESDNAALRGLLKEAKNELVDLNVRMSKMAQQEDVAKAAASSAAANAEIDALKREVERSREQLREKHGASSSEVEALRHELSRAQSGLSEKTGECAALSSQLGAVKLELKQARDDLAEKLSKISQFAAEVAALKSESASAGSDAEKLNRQIAELKRSAAAAAEEFEAKLAAQHKKLTQEGDARVSELEKRLETEKEEMMEALAQEVEVREERSRHAKDLGW
jgi:chromosome segregation ATPase